MARWPASVLDGQIEHRLTQPLTQGLSVAAHSSLIVLLRITLSAMIHQHCEPPWRRSIHIRKPFAPNTNRVLSFSAHNDQVSSTALVAASVSSLLGNGTELRADNAGRPFYRRRSHTASIKKHSRRHQFRISLGSPRGFVSDLADSCGFRSPGLQTFSSFLKSLAKTSADILKMSCFHGPPYDDANRRSFVLSGQTLYDGSHFK